MLICNPFGFGVLSKTATFGWLFNARAASFERNTVHRCARSPNQNQGGGGTVGCHLAEIDKEWGKCFYIYTVTEL